jgi:tetraacyldisaccharide 4'-kinase
VTLGAVERFARRWWGGELGAVGRALSLASAPASWAWTGLHGMRARTARGRARRVPGLHVVSVGNLAVGGTGKTPITRWIASELLANGLPTCVLVGTTGSDEAELHRRWNPGIPVFVDRDRAASAGRARVQGARAVVLDDGFQHTELDRDFDLVVISADDPFPGHVLPRGPYREAASALGRADAVLITRRAAGPERSLAAADFVERAWPGLVAGILSLAPGDFVGFDGEPVATPAGDVMAVCAVARPDAFAAAVRGMTGGGVRLVAFPDHHRFERRDVERLRREAGGRVIVVTEKDAVKLAAWREEGLAGSEVVVLRDALHWDRGANETRARLMTAVVEAEAA